MPLMTARMSVSQAKFSRERRFELRELQTCL
jgi:hypothetical protein